MTDGIQPRMIVAGPCSAESKEQIDTLTAGLARLGVRRFRAGVWKPRTRGGQFEGVGDAALAWIVDACRAHGMTSLVEVGSPRHVETALKAGVDEFWIGARTTACPFLVAEIAAAMSGSAKFVYVKNPISPDVGLWMGAIERFESVGCGVGAIHRGFATFGVAALRNFPMWWIPRELRTRRPDIQLLCDPSHIAGRRDMVAHVAHEAAQLGFDGLMVEVHPDPARALTDAAQQLTVEEFESLAASLRSGRSEGRRLEGEAASELAGVRADIAECDRQVLRAISRRLALGVRAARIKRQNGVPLYDHSQHQSIIERALETASHERLEPEFSAMLFELIHEETLKHQTQNA